MHDAWARTIVQVVEQEYPYSAHHVAFGDADAAQTPRELHPAFHGSFDWHSCVHMLATGVALTRNGGGSRTDELEALLDSRLTPANLAAEAKYLRDHPLYERPYGLAWAAQLAKECRGTRWEAAFAEFAPQVNANIEAWLHTQQAPVRHGVHDNSALALLLIHDAEPELRQTVEQTARQWFANDRDYPYRWETSGHDFVSNALAEAALMRRVLAPDQFQEWLAAFLPADAYAHFTRPIQVEHPEDGKQAHLVGLMLTRAWLLREIGKPEHTELLISAAAPHLTGTNFMATHWLITYARLADASLNP